MPKMCSRCFKFMNHWNNFLNIMYEKKPKAQLACRMPWKLLFERPLSFLVIQQHLSLSLQNATDDSGVSLGQIVMEQALLQLTVATQGLQTWQGQELSQHNVHGVRPSQPGCGWKTGCWKTGASKTKLSQLENVLQLCWYCVESSNLQTDTLPSGTRDSSGNMVLMLHCRVPLLPCEKNETIELQSLCEIQSV